MVLGCGIPYVDMKGTEEDWIKLGQKVKTLRKTLEPIHRAIGLNGWWGRVRIEFLLWWGVNMIYVWGKNCTLNENWQNV